MVKNNAQSVTNRRYRKYGFNVYNYSPEELLVYAAQQGLNHIEITLVKGHSCPESFTRDRIETLLSFTAENQIELSLHLPHSINIADILPPIQWLHLDYFRKAIHLATRLRATHITAHTGNFFWFPVTHWSRRKALNRFLENIAKVISLCAESGIVIALENLVPIPHGTDHYLLGDNIDDFVYIFSKIDSPFLQFCLDTGHANMAEGVLAYLQKLADKLVCIHYHDNRGRNDDHLPVGEGTVPWQALTSELAKRAYRGPFVSECRNIRPHQAAELLEAFFHAAEHGSVSDAGVSGL